MQGLGSLPKNLASVSSLLLFNTTENPYKKYVTVDPLKGAVTKTRLGMFTLCVCVSVCLCVSVSHGIL